MLGAIAPLIGAGISGLFGMLGSKKQADQSAAIARANIIAQQQANERNIQFTSEQNALNRQMQEAANAAVLADKERDRSLQYEFAKSGIQWRADDARAAGIHPIYALGGSGASYSPSAVSIGVPSQAVPSVAAVKDDRQPSSNWLGNFGQDIGRAINATRIALERDNAYETSVRALTLTKMGLENDLLASQIAKLRSGPNPPFPAGSSGSGGPVPMADKFEDRPRLMAGNGEFLTDPTVSNAEDFEKRYGEISDYTFGPYIAYRDYMYSTNSWGPLHTLGRDWDRMRGRDRARGISSSSSWSGSP